MPSSPERQQAEDLEHKFAMMQCEQTYATLRTQLNLLIQVITILVVANVTILGFAVSQKLASAFLVAALFPAAVLFVSYIVFRLATPLYYTAVGLETIYGNQEMSWLVSTFASFVVSEQYVIELREISQLSDAAQKRARLDSLPKPWIGTGGGYARFALILLAVAQVALAIVLAVFFDWQFF